MKRPSLKQIEARQRNWTIRQLRGLYAASLKRVFTDDEQGAICRAIDSALTRLGAEPETIRREKEKAGLREDFAKTDRGFARRTERSFVRSFDRAW